MSARVIDVTSLAQREQQFKELFLSEYGFAKLWAGTTPLREESTRTFLLTCIRNRCLNILEHRKVITTPEVPTDSDNDDELIEAIHRYVDERLSPQTSRIIKMHFDEDQTYKEISSELGISLSAVNKHIVQGLRKLRSTFKRKDL